MTASGQLPFPTARADAIDRWFARIFVAIAGLSWAGLLLAEAGAFRFGPLILLGGGIVAVGLVVIERALRRDTRNGTSTASALAVIALAGVAKTNDTTAAANVSAAIPARIFEKVSAMIFLRRPWKIP